MVHNAQTLQLVNKIYIHGAPGSGKSTLAARIGEELGIPHVELDDLLYEKKFTVRRSHEECRRLLRPIIAQPSWVVEGCSSRWTDEAVDAADVFVVLQPSRAKLLYRTTKRHVTARRRKSGETLRDLFRLWWYVWNFHKPGHELAERKKLLYAHRSFIVLRSEKDIVSFIERLKKS